MHFALCYFHPLYGPTIFKSIPKGMNNELQDIILNIFDLDTNRESFFEYKSEDLEDNIIYSQNFSLPSRWARGQKEVLMISVITKRYVNVERLKSQIGDFITKLRGNEEIYKAFYKEQKPQLNLENDYEELINLLMDFFHSLKYNIYQYNIVKKINRNLNKYAADIVELQYSQQPELKKKFNRIQKEYTLEDTKHNLRYLIQSITFNFPEFFGNYLIWLSRILESRGFSKELVSTNIECIRDYFKKIFRKEDMDILNKFIIVGLESIKEMKLDYPSYLFDEDEFHTLDFNDFLTIQEKFDHPLQLFIEEDKDQLKYYFKLAKKYLELLIAGKKEEAIDLIVDSVETGSSIKGIYLNVIQTVQYEIGRLWELNKISVAQEHYFTAITQLTISQLYPKLFSTERKGKVLVATCIGGELHEIGIRLIADLFELDGWDTYYLGSNVPLESIIQIIKEKDADLVAISATMLVHVSLVEQLITEIRKKVEKKVKIFVGGYPFNIDKELWMKIGADDGPTDLKSIIEKANSAV